MTEIIDARGRSCPEPVLMVQQAYGTAGTLTVLVDNVCAVENITRFCKNKGGSIDVKEDGDEYTLTLNKK